MSTTAEPGLRERKKTATRRALHEAALRLAMEHGPDRVTVEAIADEAGVSRRTFSNYFGSKEEALMYGDLERIHGFIDKVRVQPADESPWNALTAAAVDYFAQIGTLDPAWIARHTLVRKHPSLLAAQVQTFTALERELSAAIADRLPGEDPGGLRVKMTAAAFMVAMRVSVQAWMETPGAQLADVLHEALSLAGRGFDR